MKLATSHIKGHPIEGPLKSYLRTPHRQKTGYPLAYLLAEASQLGQSSTQATQAQLSFALRKDTKEQATI